MKQAEKALCEITNHLFDNFSLMFVKTMDSLTKECDERLKNYNKDEEDKNKVLADKFDEIKAKMSLVFFNPNSFFTLNRALN